MLVIIYKVFDERFFIMRICICDDDTLIHERVKELLKSYEETQGKFEFTDFFSGETLVEHYSKGDNFDVIFLDIEMKELNGIETAEKIRQITSNSIIIFVSSHPNYVFDAFRVEALHFLVKPIPDSEFKNVFDRALHKYNTINSTISLKWQNERYNIKIAEIKYIEGYKRHVTVYTKSESFEALGKITEILKELEPHGFVRTHQGFIVNMDFIKRFDSNDIILFDDSKIMLSVRMRRDALQKFDNYIKRKKW